MAPTAPNTSQNKNQNTDTRTDFQKTVGIPSVPFQNPQSSKSNTSSNQGTSFVQGTPNFTSQTGQVQEVTPSGQVLTTGGFSSQTGQQQVVSQTGQVISTKPIDVLQARGYTQQEAHYLVAANLGRLPNERGLQEYNRASQQLGQLAQRDIAQREQRVKSGEATQSYSGFTGETINKQSIAQKEAAAQQQTETTTETVQVSYYQKLIGTTDYGEPIYEYHVKEGNKDRLATEAEKNLVRSTIGYAVEPKNIIQKGLSKVSSIQGLVEEKVVSGLGLKPLTIPGKVFNALLKEDVRKGTDYLENKYGFSEKTITKAFDVLDIASRTYNPIDSGVFKVIGDALAEEYSTLRYDPVKFVSLTVAGMAFEGALQGAKAISRGAKLTLKEAGFIDSVVPGKTAKFLGKLPSAVVFGTFVGTGGVNIMSAQVRGESGGAQAAQLTNDLFFFSKGGKLAGGFITEPIITRKISGYTESKVESKQFYLTQGEDLKLMEKYKITIKQEPAQIEWSTRFRQLLGESPLKELKPGKTKITTIETPLYSEVGKEGFFVVERSGKKTVMSQISGIGEPTELLKAYPHVQPIEKALIEELSGYGKLGRATRERVAQELRPLEYARKQSKIEFKELDFKEMGIGDFIGLHVPGKGKIKTKVLIDSKLPYEWKQRAAAHEFIHAKTPDFIMDINQKLKKVLPYRALPAEILAFGLEKFYAKKGFTFSEMVNKRPEAEKIIPSLFKKDSQLTLGEIKRTERYTGKGMPPTVDELVLGQVQYGKATTTSRYLTEARIIETAEGSPFELFATKQRFKDVTKPGARASGEFPELKGITVRLKKPVTKVADLDSMEFKEPDLKANRDNINQGTGQLFKQETVFRELPKVFPKLRPLKAPTVKAEPVSKARGISQSSTTMESVPSSAMAAITRELTVERTRPSLSSNEISRELNIERSLSRENTRELNRERSIDRVLNRDLTRELSRELNKERSIEKQKVNERTIERSLTRQINRIITNPRITTTRRTTFTNRTPLGFNFNLKEGKTKKRSFKGFDVFVIKNRRPTVVARGVSRGSALDIGAKEILGDLKATFGLRESKLFGREAKTGGEFARFRNLFREPTRKSAYRKLGEVYIQRQSKVGMLGGRLSFRGEKRAIQRSRFNNIARSIA